MSILSSPDGYTVISQSEDTEKEISNTKTASSRVLIVYYSGRKATAEKIMELMETEHFRSKAT